jgi:mono/diheme cytochrome c family protein
MNRLIRHAALAAQVSAAGCGLLGAANAQTAQTPVQRGEYLVNAVMACDGCHTPRGPGGSAAMDKRMSGGSQVWDEAEYLVKGSNITQDRDTGVGTWSVADIKRSLIEGVRPNGVPLAPQMPYSFYKILTPADLDAVVAYIRTMPAVKNEVQPPVYKAAMHAATVPGGEKPMPEAEMRDPVKRGFYLATIAHCMECHAKKPDGKLDFSNNLGKGGYVMKGPFGEALVSNITSHPTKGIGGWTDAELKRALVEAKGKDGRTFKPPMARHIYYSKMTETDLNALIAYVRTIPPLE